MSLLAELAAFYLDHRRCGDLDAGAEGLVVWIACDCGASMARRVDEACTHLPSIFELSYRLGMDRRRFLVTSLAGVLAGPLAAVSVAMSRDGTLPLSTAMATGNWIGYRDWPRNSWGSTWT